MIKELIGYAIMFVLMVDILGFIAWATTGQKPEDNFHAGIISESIIKLVIQ